MAFYTAATQLNLARTPDVFTNAFALQSCQGSTSSYSASNSVQASSSFSSASSSSSSNPTSPYTYKTSRARTQLPSNNSAMNATSSSSASSSAGSSIRGAADLLQNTFALASKPWRTASAASLAASSASGLKQDTMPTPPMTSTFSSRTMMGGVGGGSNAGAGMGYGNGSAGSSSGSTPLAYPASGSAGTTLATPTSMVVEEATIRENVGAGSRFEEAHPHHQTQAYHHPQHPPSQPLQEYHHHHSSYQHPPPVHSQNHIQQYREEGASHQQQQRMTLPPIAHLERRLPPLTPPADFPLPQIQVALPSQAGNVPATQTQNSVPSQTRAQVPLSKPSPQDYYASSRTESTTTEVMPVPAPSSSQMVLQPNEQSNLHKNQPQAVQPNAPSYVVDWLDFTRTRSAHFIAEKTCEMICYLWFARPSASNENGNGMVIETPPATPPNQSAVLSNGNGSDGLFASPVSLPAAVPSSKGSKNSAPSTLQLRATPTFVSFMQKLLETTQVSQSVIVLSLHYIFRLKEKNKYTPAQPGSEFRIAVAGLMMGNKFLDDNTYTNKTWSEVSGIDLAEINHMEREFLLGVDFNLYVDKVTYESWLNLLKGLVLAKERDCRRFGTGSRSHRHGRIEGRERDGRGERDGRAEREREREREERKRKVYGSIGPAARTYTTGNMATTGGARSSSTYRNHTHYRARSTSPTLRMSSSTSAAVLGAPPPMVASQTAAVYLPYPPAQQHQQQQTTAYAPPPATAPSGYYPPTNATSASNSSYAYTSQSQGQSQAHGSYTSLTSTSTYAPLQQTYQTSSSASHQQYTQQTQSHASSQVPSMQASVPAYAYPTATPYASYPSGTSSAYTSPSPAPASVAPVHHAPSSHHAHPVMHISTAIPRSGSKRTAEAAFSPTSASFAQDVCVPPAKTRSMRLPSGTAISLRIPDVVSGGQGSSGGASASPLEGLGSFERMSLGGEASRGASPTREREEREERERERERQRGRESVQPTTLSSRYSYTNDGKRGTGPQNLYFYTLACSPLKPEPASSSTANGYSQNQGSSAEDMQTDAAPPVKEDGAGYGYRKARLRYHQPVLSSNAPYAYADLNASRGVGVGVSVYNASSSSSFNPYAAPIPTISGWPPQHQQQQHAQLPSQSPLSQYAKRVAPSSSAQYESTESVVPSGPLPHFPDNVWARPPAPAYPTQPQQTEESSEEEDEEDEEMEEDEEQEEDRKMSYGSTGPGAYTESPLASQSQAPSSKSSSASTIMYAPQTPPQHNYHQVQHAAHNAQYSRTPPSARIPSAPFANAGPPGVGVVFYEDSSPLRPLQYVPSHSNAAGSVAAGGAAASGGYSYQPPATSGGYPTHSHGQQPYSYAYGNGYGYSYVR